MTLIKGMVCTGILYYPRTCITAGWGFQIICMTLSCLLTMYCAKLLLQCKEHVKHAKDYSDIGLHLYGINGKRSVDLALVLS